MAIRLIHGGGGSRACRVVLCDRCGQEIFRNDVMLSCDAHDVLGLCDECWAKDRMVEASNLGEPWLC